MADYLERIKQESAAREAKDSEEQRIDNERKDKSFERTLKIFADEKIGSKPFWVAMVAALLLLVLFLVLAFTVNGTFGWGVLSVIVVYIIYNLWYSNRRDKMIEEVKESRRKDEAFRAKFADKRAIIEKEIEEEESKAASDSASLSRRYDDARDRRTAESNQLKYSAHR